MGKAMLIVGEKGKGGGSGNVAKEAPNTLFSNSIAKVIDLIGEGEIQGLVNGAKSIYLNDTPLQNSNGSYNFSGVTVQTRDGTPDQAYMPGFGAVENEIAVEAEVTKATAVTRTITDPDLDAVRVKLRIPQLTYQDKGTGDLKGYSVEIKIKIQSSGGGWVEVFNDTITGKTVAPYETQYVVDLPVGGAPWNVRLERVSDDHPEAHINDKTFFSSYTELTYAKLSYPDCAVIGIAIDAEQFGTSIPKRSYDVYGLIIKVPSNYNTATRAYTGLWDGTFKLAWSDNPAWVFYDLLTNERYGLGDYVDSARVDKWGLYQIAQYCDELVDDGFGGQEPRFTFNGVLNTRREAYAVLNNLASTFRGMVYWGAGVVVATQDAPADAVKLVAPANVIGGEFKYSGKPLNDRATVALVTWNDPADGGRATIEVVQDAEGIAQLGWRTADIVAYGCTSRGQAQRFGRWHLDTQKNEIETLNYRCSYDHADLRPGAIIKVSDPSIVGERLGGRIKLATSNTVTFDSPPILFFAVATYTLAVVLPDGSIEQLPCQSFSSGVMTVDGSFSQLPQVGAIWMLSSPAIEPRQYRVNLVVENSANIFSVTATRHDPNKYLRVEQGILFDPAPETLLPTGEMLPPIDCVLQEYLYHDGVVVKAALTISAELPNEPRIALIEMQVKGPNDADYVSAGNPSSSPTIDVYDVRPGAYQARTRTISSLGLVSPWFESNLYQVLGKTAPPSAPENFAAAIRPDTGVVLTIDPIPDLDRDEYAFYVGDTFADAVLLIRAKATEYVWKTAAAGEHTFWVVASDTSGNDSTPVSTTLTINPPDQPVVTSRYDDRNVVFDWLEVSSDFALSAYRIKSGGSVIAEITSTTFSQVVNWQGAKSFTVEAIDIAKNASAAGAVEVNPTPPNKPSVSNQVIDNNVLLKYSSVAGSLPIDHYRLLKGATFATAVNFAEKAGNSTFTTLFESVKGNYIYWLLAVDSAGNASAEASTAAFVSQPPDYILFARYTENANSWDGSITNGIVMDNGNLIMPVDASETYQAHFDSRSWASPQAQVDAGYPYYMQPSTNTGSYEKVIDYGSIIEGSLVTASPTYVMVSGSATLTMQLSYSSDGVSYTDAPPGAEQVFASNFRYIKVHIDIAGAGGDDLVELIDIETRLDKKLINDAGTASCLAGDANGTQVSFEQSFIDVQSITLTAKGTTAITAIYDFVDAPYPTEFFIYLFDNQGNRVSGDCAWSVKGY
ncbi:phage tail protein [Dasania sp. GY-MA-18]|uniref:Phage tail protein n=1 Tax=Dasania phycosphaerae TaxID=2950436 RepID=A0A9J6RM94_9GAMM|nr:MULTISPECIES: phage tail protein [Dasania]MCR8922671.1 phage tail protein [Dasania sp. GY-MA-18]MCZ0865101.1 phage tail protein [Dasania phycosphaerae]MCZ0868827.1 phage tail protein [Dasania phycosphaerae]